MIRKVWDDVFIDNIDRLNIFFWISVCLDGARRKTVRIPKPHVRRPNGIGKYCWLGSARLAKLVPLHSFGSNDWFMRSGANEMIIFRGSSRGSVSTPQQWKRKKNPTTYENATAYDVVVMYIRCGWRGNRNCKIIFKHLLHKNKNY